MDTVIERARAKVNLTLHVGAPRADGYHPLESLVVFARAGDVLRVSEASEFSLSIDGPFAAGLETDESNLILKAAFAAHSEYQAGKCAFKLTKNLPLASGIGGGSADAAAVLRAMARLDGKDPQTYSGLALDLGADVPVCMIQTSCVMRGIGESVTQVADSSVFSAVLVNPGVGVSTADIFKRFDSGNLQPLRAQKYKGDLIGLALGGRNDLQASACEFQPEIVRVLLELACQNGVRLSRMSGSGATCFAVFNSSEQAKAAAEHLQSKYPAWWVRETQLGGPA